MNKHIPKHVLPPKIPRLKQQDDASLPFMIKRHILTLIASVFIFPFLGFQYFGSGDHDGDDDLE